MNRNVLRIPFRSFFSANGGATDTPSVDAPASRREGATGTAVPDRRASHPESRRLHALDLLRGLCALGVAAFHYRMWSNLAFPGWAQDFLQMFGTYGVSIFFALSGYSLAHAYRKDFAGGVTAGGLGQYWRRRFARLAPLFGVVSLLSVAGKVVSLDRQLDVPQLLASLTLMFGFVSPAATPVIGGWSIGVEVVFYLVFPILLLMPWRWAALSALFVGILATNDVAPMMTLADGWSLYVRPANHWIFFCGGVLLQGLQMHWRAPRMAAWAAIAVSVAVAVAVSLGSTELEVVTSWRRALLVPCSLAIVMSAAALDVRSAFMRRLCALGGGASYPLYLIHPLLYYATHKHFPVTTAGGWAVLLAIAVAAALVVDRFCDVPMQRWLKRHSW